MLQNKAALFSIALFLLLGCHNRYQMDKHSIDTDKIAINQLNWILGTWKSMYNDQLLYEIWNRESDTSFKAVSFILKGRDTLFSEKIYLKQFSDSLFYIPSVSNQNQGLPVLFKLKTPVYGDLIFENKNHDFPQRIIYTNIKYDSLYARIEGMDKGKYRTIEFRMGREKK